MASNPPSSMAPAWPHGQAPVLVLANKQDLPDAMSAKEVCRMGRHGKSLRKTLEVHGEYTSVDVD